MQRASESTKNARGARGLALLKSRPAGPLVPIMLACASVVWGCSSPSRSDERTVAAAQARSSEPRRALDSRGASSEERGAEASDRLHVLEALEAYLVSVASTRADSAGRPDPRHRDDSFGSALAISSDGDVLAVGVPGDGSVSRGIGMRPVDEGDDVELFSGAVYVFRRGAQGWALDAYIKAADADWYDKFGTSVALSARGDVLAVGAPGDDSSARGVGGDPNDVDSSGSGAVYVFRRGAQGWAQEAYVKASNTGEDDGFGSSVALSPEGNLLAVGAPHEDSDARGVGGDQDNDRAPSSGAVYVFRRGAQGWAQEAYVKASNTGEDDGFGSSVGLSSEAVAEGPTLAVGAPGEDSDARGVGGDQHNERKRNAGAVYVFRCASGRWTQEAYVKASNTAEDYGEGFGSALSLSFDGRALAVGAPHEASSGRGVGGEQQVFMMPHSGAVYVFRRGAQGWAQEAYVKATNTGAGDEFGASVALSPDGRVLAVGAPSESSDASGIGGDPENDRMAFSGAVYVLHRTAEGWSHVSYVKATRPSRDDNFGFALALGSNGLVLAAGAPEEGRRVARLSSARDEGDGPERPSSGAVYVYR